MSKGVKLLAALMEDEVGSGQRLMGAARTLTGAVCDLLKAVEPASGEVHSSPTHRARRISVRVQAQICNTAVNILA